MKELGYIVVTVLLGGLLIFCVYAVTHQEEINSIEKKGVLVDLYIAAEGTAHIVWSEGNEISFADLSTDDIRIYRTKNVESNVTVTYMDNKLCESCNKPAIIVYLAYDYQLDIKRP